MNVHDVQISACRAHTRTCPSTQPHICPSTARTISKATKISHSGCVWCACTPVCVSMYGVCCGCMYARVRMCMRCVCVCACLCVSVCVSVSQRAPASEENEITAVTATGSLTGMVTLGYARTCPSTQPHTCLSAARTIFKAANLSLCGCVWGLCAPTCVCVCTHLCVSVQRLCVPAHAREKRRSYGFRN
jgi:hypothetical protein